MADNAYLDRVAALCRRVGEAVPGLRFTMLEVGALPLGEGGAEPFYQLLDGFPGSRVIAFETDQQLCERLNAGARPGLRYYPVALGRRDEMRTFYETRHPACASLYEPDEQMFGKYHHLDVAGLKAKRSIQTIDLDSFAAREQIGSVDFIKIDVQGAELDVFQGGAEVLQGVVFIVGEVGFIPLYKQQPLYGDVNTHLSGCGFMFHRFLGLEGRTIQPVVLNNDPLFATQHMWSDALFIRDLDRLEALEPHKVVKLGVLAYLYGSVDVAYYCFNYYDDRHRTSLHTAIA